MSDDLIFIGYTHASIIGIHRPDVAYPDRKIRQGKKSYGATLSDPCPCADEHVEIWVRRIPKRRVRLARKRRMSNGDKIRTVA